MQIVIENKTVEIDLPQKEISLQYVVEEVEEFLLSEGKVPIALSIDGVLLSQERLDQADKHILIGSETLHFGVTFIEQFMLDQLSGIANIHDSLIQQIQKFSQELADQSIKDFDALFSEFHHFFEFWTNLYKIFPQECDDLKFGELNFELWLNSLSEKLKETVEALEKKDYILASDLTRYEIIPAIQVAKPAIPKMEEKFTALLAAK